MTQEAPRCQVVVALAAHGNPYRVCNRPLVPTEGPCEFVYPNTGRGRGGFSGQTMTGCEREPEALVHAEGHPLHHPYQPPFACPVHSAAPDRGEA